MKTKEKNKSKINSTATELLSSIVETKNPLSMIASDLATAVTVQPKNYLTAIDYISAQSGKLNAVTNQINFLTSAAYQSSISTVISGVQNHLSAFSTIQSYLPKIDHLASVSPILDISRQATLAISGLTAPSVMTGLTASIGINYQPWYEENIAKSSILSASAYSTLNLADTSKNLATIIGTQNLSTLSLQSSIVKATEFSLFAEKSLYAVTTENLGSKITLAPEPKDYLTSSFIGLSDSYLTLLKSFESNPLSYTQISPSISRIAPLEYFSTANLLETISVDEDITPEEELLKNKIYYENEIMLSSHLSKVEPRLYKMWKGAIEAYNSNNTDRVRHFSISIRELYTHLLQILAPEDAIKKWSTDPTYYHEGRPTRKARLLFICRNINNSPFNTFVKKDIDATIAFIDIFQKGTHDIDPIFTPNQLLTIKSKAESTLKFLLQIHFTANN
ncbi:MAG: hypothetical protein VB075_04230 [Petrimonas sp.]|uniref:pPIWI-associating nuclease domain-containing protein n=1 Tax=Petrimonas sp. TaxID=2023866 RepID=UPI002B3D9863|nr:hypothetical protein [Petrimonas sp.]